MTTDARIEGFGTITSGEYDTINIDGVGKIEGNIVCRKIDVDGTCNGRGNIEGTMMDVDGMMKIDGDIRVKQLDIDGMLKSDCGKIYADYIKVDGMLKNSGEVNADRICIDGCATLNDLFGDEITINFANRGIGIFGFVFGKGVVNMNTANNIECSTLRASNIKCHSICANDIILSAHCVVDSIQCDGTLRFDSSCKIGEITGDCKQTID